MPHESYKRAILGLCDVIAQAAPHLGARLRFIFAPASRQQIIRQNEWRMVTASSDGKRARDITGFTREQIVSDVLEHLQRWRAAL